MDNVTGIDTFVPIVCAMVGGIAAGLWNKFNNRRADSGVRRQVRGYAAAVFLDLTILAKSMRVGHRSTLPYGINTLIGRAHQPDVAVALNARQAEALYEAVSSLVSLRGWFAEEMPASTWQDLPDLAMETVYSSVCILARLMITFGDDLMVISLTPEAVRNSDSWTLYVMEASLVDRARFLVPVLNWWARKNGWKPFPNNPAATERVRRFFGAKWAAPRVEISPEEDPGKT